jgi:hypothetical protein
MRLVYAIPLLIALGFAWLGVRYFLERRKEQRLRERLHRQRVPPKVKSRGGSERSEMRAGDDATTVIRTIKRRQPPTPAQSSGRHRPDKR